MNITTSEIKRIVRDNRNYTLSASYYEMNLLESLNIEFNSNNRIFMIHATIIQPPYVNDIEIKMYASGTIISYACECPYCSEHSACAHVGLVLLFIQDVKPEIFPYTYHRDAYANNEVALTPVLKPTREDVYQRLQEKQEQKKKEYEKFLYEIEQQKRNADKENAKQLIEESRRQLQNQIKPVFACPVRIQLCKEANDYYTEVFTVSLRVGNKKMYVVKNIEDFIQHIENEDVVNYGKFLEFKHTLSIFDESSKEIITLIKNWLLFDNPYIFDYSARELVIASRYMDEFFAFAETLPSDYLNFSCAKEAIQMSIHVEKEQDDYAVNLLYPRKNNKFYEGSAHLYEFKNKQLQQRSLDSNGNCMALYHTLSQERLLIDQKDITDFYQYVLSDCESYLTIEGKELLPELLVENNIELMADIDEEGIINIQLICYFDEYRTQGFSDSEEKIPLHLQLVEDYIKEYATIIDYDQHRAYIDGDTDISVAFVEEGLFHLAQFCDVFVSDELKNINQKHAINMQVGVRIKNNLLELNFDSTDIDKNELYEVLKAYRKKKKFHRLQNGKLLMLDSKQLEETSQILEDLDVPLKDCQHGSVTLPLYRTLYMDEMLQRESTLDIERKKTFDTFITNFQNASQKEIVLPNSYDSILRDYQKSGYQWLKRMNYFHFSGILADDMGLGKTLQVIALLESEKAEGRTSIVVVPASLLLNWMDEIKKFTDNVTFACIMGTADERKLQIATWKNYDVLITSYDYLRRDMDAYEGISFYYIILDEAQYIKNQKTKNAMCVKLLKGEHRLALTGTPIENSLAELWSIFDFLMPGYLYNYHYFQTHFEKDIVANHDEQRQKKLKTMVEPFILRRNKKDVLQELPEKIEKTVTISFQEEEKKLYMANFIKASKELQEKLSIDQVDKFAILSILTKLRQLCCEPSLIYDNFVTMGSKRQGCLDIIRSLKENHSKVLLFSSFTSMLDILADDLQQEGISYFMLTGKTPKEERRHLVQQFQEGNADVFLISLKAGGTGLNLTAAQAVIHYDPWWNISAQNQATDRAHRIGQDKNLQVFRLIMKDSIEEKIQKLQEKKKNLADTFVEGNDGSIQRMDMDDIINLFSLTA